MVHHYGSEIFNKLNLKHGYRAEENDLRGSMRLRDVCTKIVLINKPEQFKDLMSEYLHIEDAMNDLFITDLIKNRNSKKGVVRWFARPEINKFKEI